MHTHVPTYLQPLQLHRWQPPLDELSDPALLLDVLVLRLLLLLGEELLVLRGVFLLQGSGGRYVNVADNELLSQI